MKINAIKCKKCNDTLISRARHDFHSCSCGKTFVDGGFDYQRVGYDEKVGYEHVEVDLPVTKKELYDDWNMRVDKYGIMKNEKNIT